MALNVAWSIDNKNNFVIAKLVKPCPKYERRAGIVDSFVMNVSCSCIITWSIQYCLLRDFKDLKKDHTFQIEEKIGRLFYITLKNLLEKTVSVLLTPNVLIFWLI